MQGKFPRQEVSFYPDIGIIKRIWASLPAPTLTPQSAYVRAHKYSFLFFTYGPSVVGAEAVHWLKRFFKKNSIEL
jgi:hypothetical protein